MVGSKPSRRERAKEVWNFEGATCVVRADGFALGWQLAGKYRACSIPGRVL
jgi:hypothetical protein